MNLVFEPVFGLIPAVLPSAKREAEAEGAPVAPRKQDEEELDFGVHLTGRDNVDSIENEDIYDEDDGNETLRSKAINEGLYQKKFKNFVSLLTC